MDQGIDKTIRNTFWNSKTVGENMPVLVKNLIQIDYFFGVFFGVFFEGFAPAHHIYPHLLQNPEKSGPKIGQKRVFLGMVF